MYDREAVIAAILEKPDDNLPRLIYADCLDERGETDRAEFIRVQCAISKGAGCKHSLRCNCKECFPQRREQELLSKGPVILPSGGHQCEDNRTAWILEAMGYWPFERQAANLRLCDFTFTRGFISQIRCTAAEWQRETVTNDWPAGGELKETRRTTGQSVLAENPVERVELAGCGIKFLFTKDDHGNWRMTAKRGRDDINFSAASYPNRAALIEAMPAELREWGFGIW